MIREASLVKSSYSINLHARHVEKGYGEVKYGIPDSIPHTINYWSGLLVDPN